MKIKKKKIIKPQQKRLTVLINLENQYQVMHFPCIIDTHNDLYCMNVDFIFRFSMYVLHNYY